MTRLDPGHCNCPVGVKAHLPACPLNVSLPGAWPMTRGDGVHSNPLTPDAATLIKLGSIARHAEELLSPGGHDVDRAAIESLLSDPDVRVWMEAADKLALLPVPR